MDIREKVISAFGAGRTYTHKLGHGISGTDNFGILSLLAGAAHIAGDDEVMVLSGNWCSTCLLRGIDCRNFDVIPHDGWKYDGLFYYDETPQSSAGPLAYEWARNQGAFSNDQIWGVELKARLFCMIPSWVIRLSPFRQHLNTVMLAHLYLGKKPGSSWGWAVEGNAFYSYVSGKKCDVPDFPIYKTLTSIEKDEQVPIEERERSQWIWKQLPWKKSVAHDTNQEYTPTALLVAKYLQDSLK